MLHACDQKFDVTGNLENFCKLNKAFISLHPGKEPCVSQTGSNLIENNISNLC